MNITTDTTAVDICIAYSDASPLGGFAQAIDRIERLNELARTAAMMLEADIRRAREQGAPWAEIGNALGITRQSAHERYSTLM